jgi:hypothetical protein
MNKANNNNKLPNEKIFRAKEPFLYRLRLFAHRDRHNITASPATNKREISAKLPRNQREKHHVTTDNINNNNKIKIEKIYSRKTASFTGSLTADSPKLV